MEFVVTLTINPSLDKSVEVPQVVADQKLRSKPPRYEPGGGGINVSRVIHRLGGQSTALYTAGGPSGETLNGLLDEEDIDRQPVPIRGMTRTNLTAFDESTDQQYRFIMPGPELAEAEWRKCLDKVRALDPAPAYLVASGSLPRGVPDDFYAQVAGIAKEHDSRLIVDTSEEALREAVMAGVYLIKPNMRELGQLAGREISSEAHQEAEAEKLVEHGQAEVVVVSLGAAGTLVVWQGGSERLRAPTVPIRSKIGAGDSTVAGIVLGLAGGMELLDAVRFGMAAGAAAVMTPGTELAKRGDTEQLYERMKS